jgi:hypothetical protein
MRAFGHEETKPMLAYLFRHGAMMTNNAASMRIGDIHL